MRAKVNKMNENRKEQIRTAIIDVIMSNALNGFWSVVCYDAESDTAKAAMLEEVGEDCCIIYNPDEETPFKIGNTDRSYLSICLECESRGISVEEWLEETLANNQDWVDGLVEDAERQITRKAIREAYLDAVVGNYLHLYPYVVLYDKESGDVWAAPFDHTGGDCVFDDLEPCDYGDLTGQSYDEIDEECAERGIPLEVWVRETIEQIDEGGIDEWTSKIEERIADLED